jgi:hypothetical protein
VIWWVVDCLLLFGLTGFGLVFVVVWVAGCYLGLGLLGLSLRINKLGYCLVELGLLSTKIWWACYSFIRFSNF